MAPRTWLEAEIVPVVLAGGSGTRLWPLSRPDRPKQFLPLLDDRSLFQATVLRVAGHPGFAPPVVVCNADHRFLVQEQLAALGVAPRAILVEPEGRNTAPAAALAAAALAGDGYMLLMPADHAIADAAAFRDAVGPFGTLLYAGKDWKDRELGRQSMILMAEQVMPLVNAGSSDHSNAAE